MKKKYRNGRLTFVAAIFVFLFAILILRYYSVSISVTYANYRMNYTRSTVEVDGGSGFIYDRNLVPLVNCSESYYTVAIDSPRNDELRNLAVDKSEFDRLLAENKPFKFETAAMVESDLYATSFKVLNRYGGTQLAQHLIGYRSQGVGVSGLEYAYNSMFNEVNGTSSVTYFTDGQGNILLGEGNEIVAAEEIKCGVVTTIDAEIQQICEDAAKEKGKGAVVVAEIATGDIVGMASFPSYSLDKLDIALSDSDCPLINRNLYSYNVGSVFKLVTACHALENGLGDFTYECTGTTDVCGKTFRCHNLGGHGLQNMSEAMTNSCNTYFIELSKNFEAAAFRETAYNLGFGHEIQLSSGVIGTAGNLPTKKELQLPAELANFSFGQGKLTATPLQILQLTCCIANNGQMPILRVIRGLTLDGKTVENEKKPQLAYAMDVEIAKELRRFMASAINNNIHSKAKPNNTIVCGKTSTAQTGRFDEAGEELYNGWITGFFPENRPKYAVTVLVEDGGYGNDAAAPIFREVVEGISRIKSK